MVEFPRFKSLEISDQVSVEAHTKKYEPYSDFDFHSMWSWNVDERAEFSWCNNNLIIKFSDYVTGEPFYSILGDTEIDKTIATVFNFLASKELAQELRLVPEVTTKAISANQFFIEEDRNNFDYIISFDKLKPRENPAKLSTRRKMINSFKELRNPKLKLLNLLDPKVKEALRDICYLWEIQKGVESEEANRIYAALNRLLSMSDFSNILAFGAYLEDRLVGYSINGLREDGYALGHFMQADLKLFSGIYAYLMQESAPFFLSQGKHFINLEQDLGIPGLRKWKESYRPERYLKKFRIMPQFPTYL